VTFFNWYHNIVGICIIAHSIVFFILDMNHTIRFFHISYGKISLVEHSWKLVSSNPEIICYEIHSDTRFVNRLANPNWAG
jgi:hypothetical protein